MYMKNKNFWQGFFTALACIVAIDILLWVVTALLPWTNEILIGIILALIHLLVFLPSLFIFGYVGKEKGIQVVGKRLVIMGFIVIAFIIILPLVVKIV